MAEESKTLSVRLQIPPGSPAEGQRLDSLVLPLARSRAPALSKASLKELFRLRNVRLAGRPLSASDSLPAGTYELTITGIRPEEFEALQAKPAQAGSFLPVLYEDPGLLVLDKKSGTPSLPHSPSETETAVGAALAHFPALSGVGRGGLEPGLLHRLDTGTSGALAFAKTEPEFQRLRAIWASGAVRKIYRAIVSAPTGKSAPETLRAPMEIRFALAHDPDSAKRMVALLPGKKIRHRGKPLPTLTRILNIRKLPDGRLDLEIEIQTGVMHQIRCTLAALSWPIGGDPIYRGTASSRLWLHAWKLEIPQKEKGTRLIVESPLPENWPS